MLYVNIIRKGSDIMASAMIHIAVANEINKVLKRDKAKILIGSIAPDMSKLIGQTKVGTHFLDVNDEIEAPQMDKFLETGFKPTHIDWHWCHTPVQMQVAMEMAVKYNLPLRAHDKEREEAFSKAGIKYVANHYNEYYNHDQSNPTTTPDNLIAILKNRINEGCTEMSMMVHPAYVDKTLMKLSSYNIIRATELEALLDPKVIAFIKENNIEMISYKDI